MSPEPLAAAPAVVGERTCWPAALPVDPALFLFGNLDASIDPAAACPDGTPPFRYPGHTQRLNSQLSRLARLISSRFGSFWRSGGPESGHTNPSPAASTGRRSCHSGTLRERPAGPKHTRAEQDQKLGRLHRARQALVRVPESSTKYGGKTEITGGAQPLRCRQLSVSPEGFPRKKLSDTRQPKLRPAVHRRTIYCRQGVALPRLTRSYRWAGQACPPIDGHGAKDTAWCRRFPTV